MKEAVPPTLARAGGGNGEGEDAMRAVSVVRTTTVCLDSFPSSVLIRMDNCEWEVVYVF